jgi:hypothetical protein
MTPERKKEKKKKNWARARERERGVGEKNAKEPMKSMSTFFKSQNTA